MNTDDNKDPKKEPNSKRPGKTSNQVSFEENLRIIRNSEEFYDPSGAIQKRLRTKLTREELLAGHSAIEETRVVEFSDTSDPRLKNPDEFLLRAASRKKAPAPDPIIIKTEAPEISKNPEPASISESGPLSPPDSVPHFGIPDLSTLRKELEEERREFVREEPEPVESKVNLQYMEPTPASPETNIPSIKVQESSFSSMFGSAQFENTKPKEEIVSEELNRQHAAEIQQWKDYAAGVKAWQNQVMQIMAKLKAELKGKKELEQENESLKNLVEQKDREIQHLKKNSSHTVLGWLKSFGRAAA